ncbi:MAG: Spy/CpxP family protein refolding chaperone [Ignavibacteriaceae bacterium]
MNKRIIFYAAVFLTIVNLAALGTWMYNRFSAGALNNEQRLSLSELRTNHFEQLKEELSLTGKQIAEVKALRNDFFTQIDSLSTQLAGKRTELAKEIWRSELDSAKVNNLVNEIGKLQSAAQFEVLAHLHQVKNLLTPGQQKKFYSIILQRFTTETDQPQIHNPRF